jgi:hypothetical protein
MKLAELSLLVTICFAAGTLSAPLAAGQSTCGNAKINGEYGFSGTGLVPQKPKTGAVSFDPMNEIAAVSYDGAGGLSVKFRIQYHGTLGPVSTMTGTYTVNNDCTGLAEFKDQAGTVISSWAFVVVHSGEEIETMALIAATSSRPMYAMDFSQKKV